MSDLSEQEEIASTPVDSSNGAEILMLPGPTNPEGSDLESWVNRLNASLNKAVGSAIHTAKEMAAARDALEDGSFAELATRLKMSKAKCVFLVKIGQHPVLTNPTYHERLPNGYNALYHLSCLDEATLIQHIEAGEVSRETTTQEARALSSDKDDAPQSSEFAGVEAKLKVTIRDGEKRQKFFEALYALSKKHDAEVADAKDDGLYVEWLRGKLAEQAEAEISTTAQEVENVTIEQLRLVEDAITEVLSRTEPNAVLDETYAEFDALTSLLDGVELSRKGIKKWCNEHNVPNQLMDLSKLEHGAYVWEQVRRVARKEADSKRANRRLKKIGEKATSTDIKALAEQCLELIAPLGRAV